MRGGKEDCKGRKVRIERLLREERRKRRRVDTTLSSSRIYMSER